ncbi:hypothetical protein Pfo_008292 [Paulownia fortunei]|nr:hypothetical protein Pfo_008292 [Paulownia fortunei]
MLGNNQDFTELSGLTFYGSNENQNCSSDVKSQLCIPDDNLDDLEFFPNFSDDLIPLSGLLLTPEHESLNPFVDIESTQDPGKDLWKAGDGVEKPLFSENSSIGEVSFAVYPGQEIEWKGRAPKVSSTEQEIGRKGIASKVSSTEHNKKRKLNNDDIDGSKVLYFNDIGGSKVLCFNLNRKPRSIKPKRKSCFRSPPLTKRSCCHCGAEKTPQWRMGPDGPKSLCNACGVRYKSGRLLPEYRPAASPNFDSMKHSNFHRKIMLKKLSFEDDAGEVLN